MLPLCSAASLAPFPAHRSPPVFPAGGYESLAIFSSASLRLDARSHNSYWASATSAKAPSCSLVAKMDAQPAAETGSSSPAMKLLFVEMGVGYDQHGQDITVAAMRACRDAIASNSIPAFRRGSIPGVNSDQMKLSIKLGVPKQTQHLLDIDKVKTVFPYGEILKVEVVDGGLVCSSGVCIEEMGDKNEDCYVVNAAVYVGY